MALERRKKPVRTERGRIRKGRGLTTRERGIEEVIQKEGPAPRHEKPNVDRGKKSGVFPTDF